MTTPEKPYTPRVGSICHRAILALDEHGAQYEHDLKRLLEMSDVDHLHASLASAVKAGVINHERRRIGKKGVTLWFLTEKAAGVLGMASGVA